jgi:hypothetical protein
LREIDQVTLWEANELFEYWQNHPPVHVLVAAYLTGGKRSSTHTGQNRNKLDELVQAISGLGGSITKKLPQIYGA